MNKRDIVSSRTPGDTERKYAKRIIDSENKAKSQEVDLASLNVKLNNLNNSITAINNQISEINELIESSISNINTRMRDVERTSHSHINQSILDRITQADINKWNNSFKGDYITLAENITVNQQIQYIDDYNLILLQISNVNRYIPCFKYGDTFKGILLSNDNGVGMEEISIQMYNETVINIVCTNSILKIIGIY